MRLLAVILICILSLSCHRQSKEKTENKEIIDFPHIVIINLEEGDRAFIGDVLMKIDSCTPKMIGLDTWFVERKDDYQDSVLQLALSKIQNEILGYFYDYNDSVTVRSHAVFRQFSNDSAICQLQVDESVMINFIPKFVIDGKVHEHMALKIAKRWNPLFKDNFKPNEMVAIQYKGNLDKLQHLNGSDLNPAEHKNLLKDKIVLLGYTGPSNEDKFVTMMNQHGFEMPDAYGVVIMANEVQQLLSEN